MIAHDREFLDRTVSRIVHIEAGAARIYSGNYSAFEEQRAAQLAQQQAMYERQQREIRHMMSFVERFRAKASKARQAQSRLKALERMERIAPAHVDSPFEFSFLPPQKLPRPLLTLERQCAGYGERVVLDYISMTITPGSRIALLGRNGAGKSTTLKCIIGLVRPTRGQVTFAGHKIAGLAPHQIARMGLGYVPEERRVFADLTVEENLEVGRQPTRPGAPVWTVERLYALFPNLAALRRRPAGRTSGGEQQMLTIARTLMGNPRAVLLDEPSEGLAPVIVEQMIATILELKRDGLTILLSEQNLRFAQAVADRAVIIETGAIRYRGTIEALAADEEVRATYLTV
jgi:branched-chain amino acid transport system ATP-binding protein